MKKLTLLIAALFGFALVFTGCSDDSGSNEPDNEKVEDVSIAEIATINGKKAEQKEIFASKEEFNSVLTDSAIEEIFGIYNDNLSAVIKIPGLNSRSADEELTIKDIDKSFGEFKTELMNSAIASMSNADGTINLDVDWKAPTGKIKFVDNDDAIMDGISTKINEISLNLNASVAGFFSDDDKLPVTAGGNASGKADFTFDFCGVEGAEIVKNAKFNLLGGVDVTNLALSADPSVRIALMKLVLRAMISGSEVVADEVASSDEDEEDVIMAVLNTITSVSGNVKGSAGVSGAFYFEVTDPETKKEYNGVVKGDCSLKADTKLSIDLLKNIIKLEEMKPTDENYNLALYDLIPVKVKVLISLYDVNGNKIFDLLDVSKLSELVPQINELKGKIPVDAED